MKNHANLCAGDRRHLLLVKLLTTGFLLILSLVQLYAQEQAAACSSAPFSFRLPGSSGGTTYTWTAPTILPAGAITGGSAQATPQSAVSEVLKNITNATATATYTVTPSTGTSFQLEVSIYPLPALTSVITPPDICTGTSFQYLPTSNTNQATTSFSWSRQQVAGISNGAQQGSGNPNETLVNTTITPVTVEYIYNLNFNGCVTYNKSVKVVVNPGPILNSNLEPPAICSGTTFNYTATSLNANNFTWTRQARAGINGGVGSSPTNSSIISDPLVNATLDPIRVVYSFSLTSNTTSCLSAPQPISVIVYPTPNVGNKTIPASCSQTTFLESPTNVPLGTTYTWGNPTMLTSGSISGGSAQATPQLYIGQALTNNSATDQTIRYQVKPTANGCGGPDFFVDVTVNTTGNSTSVLGNTSPAPICSGNNFVFQANSTTASGGYAWQRFYNSSISQSVSNSGLNTSGLVNEQLNNTSTSATSVYYAFTSISSNGCRNTQTVAVSVNPATVLNSSLTPLPICSNTIFSYVPGSATGNTNFGWTRNPVNGISNAAATGGGNPAEILINTTNQTIPVTYRYALSTPNGCTNSQDVIVNVNPTPRLTTSLNPTAICSGTNFVYPHLSNMPATSFSWQRDEIPEIDNIQSNGTSSPFELLISKVNSPVSVNYRYTLTANNCSNTESVTVVVNPTPSVADQSITVCSGNSFTITPGNTPTGTGYVWGMPTISPLNSVNGATQQITQAPGITQLINNTSLSTVTVSYLVTPNAGSCMGVAFGVTATIKPVPAVSNQLLQPVCSGTAFALSSVAVPDGTTYTWSQPVQTPFNSLTGAGAQPIGQSIMSQTLQSSNNLTNTAVYYVTPSAGDCIGNEFTLTAIIKPVPVINNIIDTICTGSAFLIAPAGVPANTTYTWPTPVAFPFGSVVQSLPQSSPVSTLSQVLANTTTAPARTVYTITPSAGGCAGSPFDMTIVVGNTLPAFPNREITICSGTSFNATPATAPANTTYTWSVPSVVPAGTVVGLSAEPLPQNTISQTLTSFNNVTDTVVYTIQPYKTGCLGNMFTTTVRVLPSPRAIMTGQSTICRYPVDTMSVRFTGTGPWTFTYNDGTTTRTESGITVSPYTWVVPVTPVSTTRTLAITGIRDFACSSIDTSYFVQRINELPVGKVVSLHGQYICNNRIDTLFISSPDSLGKQWTHNARVIPGLVSDSIATLTPGSYNAILTNRFGCRDTAANPITLYEVKKPVVRFVYDSYCIDNLIRFTNRTDTAGIGATDWTWDFGDSTAIATTYNSTHTYLKGGKHHIKLVAHQLFCPADFTSADSTLDIQYPIVAKRMPSVSAYKRQSTPLNARDTAGYRYQWVPTKGIDDPFIPNPNFNYEVTQDYLINLISPAGCVTKDSMLVRVFDENLVNIMVPKSFSPNYDGVNDILYPYLSGIKTFHYFKVFNRFGQLMFETRNYDMGWNGSLNGVAQPMGIYIWVSTGIANDGTRVEKRGETLLLR